MPCQVRRALLEDQSSSPEESALLPRLLNFLLLLVTGSLPVSFAPSCAGRYQRSCAATRYATAAQLSAEERLVAQAQTQGAPRLPGELAARRLGADPALLEAQLREHAQDARNQEQHPERAVMDLSCGLSTNQGQTN
jgi:hypothetical protein